MSALRVEGKARPQEVLSGGARLDGRGYDEFRPVFFKTGVISQAAGSAYAELGSTKVMVGVYGPRPGERRVAFSEDGRLQCDVKLASFATAQRGQVGQTPVERDLTSVVATALHPIVLREALPKAVVDCYACIVEAGGAEAAIAATAASLALADAGIEIRDLAAACCVSRVNGSLLLDPTTDESFREDGSLFLAMMPSRNEATQLVVRGEWEDSALREAVELAMGGCLQLDGALRDCVRASIAAKAKG